MRHITKYWPFIALFAIWLIFTWPFWLKGLVPAPLDFLVGFFSPWREHYSIPIKNPAIPDVVNQIIPWKIFTIDQWKQGIIPLWNPYNLAGTPHAANWQSAVFYPANLFLILDFVTGWGLYILSQPLLAGLFTYLYARSIKLSPLGSLLSALSFAFSGFMTSWLEWGTLGHAVLWLPASLWSIEKYSTSKNPKFLILNSLFLSLSLLAGHLQVSLYVIAVSFAYWCFRSRTLNVGTILKGLTLQGLTPFLLTAFQVFPSIELYFHSLRSQVTSPGWFKFFLIPIEYLITFVAPDFFGNPTTRNEWGGGSYVEMMGYVGLIPLIFALTAILNWLKKRNQSTQSKIVPFFLVLIALSLLLALKTPLAEIVLWLKIPIFASSSPSRTIGLVSFSLAILAGIGLDHLADHKQKITQALGMRIVACSLLLLWVSVLMIDFIAPNSLLATNASIARNNLIFPTVLFIVFLLVVIASQILFKKVKKVSHKKLLLVTCYLLLVVSFADLYRFHHKFTPYTSRSYWYPNFSIRKTLSEVAKNDRVFGLFDANLNLPFFVSSPEGYDPLLLKNYVELASAHKEGARNLPERQSALSIGKNEPFTMPFINLVAAKYVVQPTVHGSAPWEFHLWEYPSQFDLIFDDGEYQIFENNQAYPHIRLETNYTVDKNPTTTISTVMRNTQEKNRALVLEKDPPLAIKPEVEMGIIDSVNFASQKIAVQVTTPHNSLVYLGDSYYPGWQAQIDGQNTEIIKANSTFRAVAVPSGAHTLTFAYEPITFKLGVMLAGITLIGVTFWTKKHAA